LFHQFVDRIPGHSEKDVNPGRAKQASDPFANSVFDELRAEAALRGIAEEK
jgi:hypothetical protein